MLASETTLPDSAMNDPNSPLRDDAGQRKQEGAPVSVGRRRFAKGVAPVVLGTLASKPVLGAPLYHCTVSGQVSGNLSRPGLAADCVIGDSRSTWLLATTWPTAIVKGVLPNKACNFPGNNKGTAFNGFSANGSLGLVANFYNRNLSDPNRCEVGTVSSTNAATMYQVLNTDPAVAAYNTDLFQLARATVISILNSYKYAPNYPVTAYTVISMFNATYNGNLYTVNASVKWTRAQVLAYLKSLYPP